MKKTIRKTVIYKQPVKFVYEQDEEDWALIDIETTDEGEVIYD